MTCHDMDMCDMYSRATCSNRAPEIPDVRSRIPCVSVRAMIKLLNIETHSLANLPTKSLTQLVLFDGQPSAV